MTEHDDPRVQDGVEHLRRAAREVIAAGRALLDVAEDVVERPDAVEDLLTLFASVGEQLRRGAVRGGGGGSHDPFLRSDDEPDEADGAGGGVFRIPVD